MLFFPVRISKHKENSMDILLEQESNMSTIAALSAIAVSKTDNNNTAINGQVQTDIVKSASDFNNNPPLNGAFNNLLTCDPVHIYFKDLTYAVQKMFSNCKHSISINV